MKSTDHTIAREQPLTSEALIEERVAMLVGRAQRRQIWLMFLDASRVQLPLLVPMAEVPVAPDDDDLQHWARFIEGTCDAAGARSVVVVIERYASEQLTDADRSWARQLRDGCALARVELRAVVLSHRRGVTLVAPHEYA